MKAENLIIILDLDLGIGEIGLIGGVIIVGGHVIGLVVLWLLIVVVDDGEVGEIIAVGWSGIG